MKEWKSFTRQILSGTALLKQIYGKTNKQNTTRDKAGYYVIINGSTHWENTILSLYAPFLRSKYKSKNDRTTNKCTIIVGGLNTSYSVISDGASTEKI